MKQEEIHEEWALIMEYITPLLISLEPGHRELMAQALMSSTINFYKWLEIQELFATGIPRKGWPTKLEKDDLPIGRNL